MDNAEFVKELCEEFLEDNRSSHVAQKGAMLETISLGRMFSSIIFQRGVCAKASNGRIYFVCFRSTKTK